MGIAVVVVDDPFELPRQLTFFTGTGWPDHETVLPAREPEVVELAGAFDEGRDDGVREGA